MAWRFLAGEPSHRHGRARRSPCLSRSPSRTTTAKNFAGKADKAYDVEAFVQALKDRSVTPHIKHPTGT